MKQANLKNYLDALIDKDGLKTEVKITLTNQTLLKTSLTLIGTVIVSTLAVFVIKAIIQNTLIRCANCCE